MLDKILNINPQEKYKSGSKITASQLYSVNRHEHDRHRSKDSALFSPLAKLMSKMNWKILSVQFTSEDELLFHFLINNIEFITVINFKELYTSSKQKFTLIKSEKKNNKETSYKVNLEVEKDNIAILNKPEYLNTDSIDELYERIINRAIYRDNNITEPYILGEIVSDLQENLNLEFNNILKAIYTYISARGNGRIKNNFILKTHKNIPIIINKVSIIYAE